jgi:MGT family glycosyltransferase
MKRARTPCFPRTQLYLVSVGEDLLSHILVCINPAPGHINPMLAVAQHLSGAGHHVTVLTGDVFKDKIVAAGLDFVAVTGIANFDYRRQEDFFPDKKNLRGMDLMVHYFKHLFGDTIPDQDRCIRQIMAKRPVDLILLDVPYLGAFPLLLGPKNNRPPIIGCGVIPLVMTSADFGPFSQPDKTPEGLLKNREATRQLEAALQPATDHINTVLASCGAPSMPRFAFDCICVLPDLFLQFTGEAFEFPRSDMPETIRFVGPVLPKPSVNFKEPVWWNDLNGGRPVVLVTQGTIANFNLNELIQPTLSALANEDMLIIAATGRPDTESIVVPSNARVEAFVPFDRLLPKVDVLVTNGGYGAVHQALSLGVPIVIAGETEDKAMISARVDWTGAGISLGTQDPTEEQIQSAVCTVLADSRYRRRAQAIQQNFRKYNAPDEITKTVKSLIEQAALQSSY